MPKRPKIPADELAEREAHEARNAATQEFHTHAETHDPEVEGPAGCEHCARALEELADREARLEAKEAAAALDDDGDADA